MFCVKCGSRLDGDKCTNCGFVDSYVTDIGKAQDKDKQPDGDTKPKYDSTSDEYRIKGKSRKKKVKEKKLRKKMLKEQTSEEKRFKEKKPWTKKRKMILIIILAASVLLAAVGSFLTIYLLNNAKYEEAISDLERDELKIAAEKFEELEGFKESEQYLEDCNTLIAYYDAVDSYEDLEYEDALKKFENLDSYEDSKSYAQLCRDYISYNGAKRLFDAGNYEQAKAQFVALGDFENSIEMADSSQINMDYNQAQEYYNRENYDDAKKLFEGILDFKDSKDRVFYCSSLMTYNEAMDKYNLNDFYSAVNILWELYDEIEDSEIDVSSVITKEQIRFYQGMCLYNMEFYYNAFQAFDLAGSYEDASIMAAKCAQPIETKELFINPKYEKNSVKMTFYGPKDTDYNVCIEIYDLSDELVSVCYVAHDEKLKVYFPKGTYYYKASYGIEWYGNNEAFGAEFERVTFEDGTDTQKLSTSYYYMLNF